MNKNNDALILAGLISEANDAPRTSSLTAGLVMKRLSAVEHFTPIEVQLPNGETFTHGEMMFQRDPQYPKKGKVVLIVTK